MLAKRIIPCLDVKDGEVVKGINFVGLREVGDPVEMGAEYSRQGADELVYLDISASFEGRKTFTELVSAISERINIPFTVGGGISSFGDAARLLDAGADKITINTAAVNDPSLITHIASHYGVLTDKELYSWAKEAEDRGAGEILFTSMDHDGERKGYAVNEYARLSELLSIPVIASGGAGSVDDMAEVLTTGKADAALAASIFHFGEIKIPDLKRQLAERQIPVRI